MPKFRVTVSQEWTEYGSVTIEAADKDEAKEAALELFSTGSDEIAWEDSDMDPGQYAVDSITQKDE